MKVCSATCSTPYFSGRFTSTLSPKQLNAKAVWLHGQLVDIAGREEKPLPRKVMPLAIFVPNPPRYNSRPGILVFLPGVKSTPMEMMECWVLQRLQRLGGKPDKDDSLLTIFQEPGEPTWEVKLIPRTWGTGSTPQSVPYQQK